MDIIAWLGKKTAALRNNLHTKVKTKHEQKRRDMVLYGKPGNQQDPFRYGQKKKP